MSALTATGLDPDPGSDAHGTLDPYELVLPYSNSQVVESPLGLTVPLSVAVVFDVVAPDGPETVGGIAKVAVTLLSALIVS